MAMLYLCGVEVTLSEIADSVTAIIASFTFFLLWVQSRRLLEKTSKRGRLFVYMDEGAWTQPIGASNMIKGSMTVENFGESEVVVLKFGGILKVVGPHSTILRPGVENAMPIPISAPGREGLSLEGFVIYQDIFGDKWIRRFKWDTDSNSTIPTAQNSEHEESRFYGKLPNA